MPAVQDDEEDALVGKHTLELVVLNGGVDGAEKQRNPHPIKTVVPNGQVPARQLWSAERTVAQHRIVSPGKRVPLHHNIVRFTGGLNAMSSQDKRIAAEVRVGRACQ